MDENNYLVRVRCMTFNHSAYIREALDGFCIQETAFPFICTIIDDASTDGEQDIIMSYLQEHFNTSDDNVVRQEDTGDYKLIFAHHKQNVNCHFAIIFLKYNHYSINKPKWNYISEWDDVKYEAICEGDDFWYSPHKLQQQVDFMEKHPDHSLCFHANYNLYSDKRKKECHPYNHDVEVVSIEDLILGGGGVMATNSMFYLGTKSRNWPEWAIKCRVGDAPLMLILATRGKVGYINELMSCYRVASNGSWTLRVSRNRKQQLEMHRHDILTWDAFDEWTNYNYHSSVKKKKWKNRIHYWIKRIYLFEYIINIIR